MSTKYRVCSALAQPTGSSSRRSESSFNGTKFMEDWWAEREMVDSLGKRQSSDPQDTPFIISGQVVAPNPTWASCCSENPSLTASATTGNPTASTGNPTASTGTQTTFTATSSSGRPSAVPTLGISLYWIETVTQESGNQQSATRFTYGMLPNGATPCNAATKPLFSASASSSDTIVLTGEFAFTSPQGFDCTWDNTDPTAPGSFFCVEGEGEDVNSQCKLAQGATEQACPFDGQREVTFIVQALC
jgi:hypothetical protein